MAGADRRRLRRRCCMAARPAGPRSRRRRRGPIHSAARVPSPTATGHARAPAAPSWPTGRSRTPLRRPGTDCARHPARGLVWAAVAETRRPVPATSTGIAPEGAFMACRPVRPPAERIPNVRPAVLHRCCTESPSMDGNRRKPAVFRGNVLQRAQKQVAPLSRGQVFDFT